MHTKQLMDYGKRSIPHFVGVFPLDKLPIHLHPPAKFIVNTDTQHLPGTHWLAISYTQKGIIYAFDPFGIFYPKLLTTRLKKLSPRKISFNNIMYQKVNEENCGQLCLQWLKHQCDYEHSHGEGKIVHILKTMSPYFIDFEAFQHGDEDFILKELVVLNVDRPLHPLYFLFKPMCQWNSLDPAKKVTYCY